MADLALAPSLYHQRRMAETRQALAYDGGDVRAWQQRLRRRLRALIGYHPPRTRTPLAVRSLWRRDHPLGTIEKLAFTSEPAADVLAYLCLPRGVKPPYPFFICLQGHSTGMHNSIAVDRDDETKPIEVAGDRDFGLGCLRRGIAALCVEQRSFGLRRELVQQARSDHLCHDAVMQALMLGTTLAAERVYDVERALDYLAARGDARMDRVGLMGNSGGGTITIYASALLPRVRLAMPSCSFSSYRQSIMSIFHCGDNYIPGLYATAEQGDVVGLFAPRPVVIVAGKDDGIFPLAGVHEQFARVQRIYAACGAPENCRLVIGPEGHRFYADLAWPVMQPFMDA